MSKEIFDANKFFAENGVYLCPLKDNSEVYHLCFCDTAYGELTFNDIDDAYNWYISHPIIFSLFVQDAWNNFKLTNNETSQIEPSDERTQIPQEQQESQF